MLYWALQTLHCITLSCFTDDLLTIWCLCTQNIRGDLSQKHQEHAHAAKEMTLATLTAVLLLSIQRLTATRICHK